MARNRISERLNRLWKRAGWQGLRKWAKRPKSLRKQMRRWATLREWVDRKVNWAKHRQKWERAKFFAKKRTVYGTEWRRARREWKERRQLQFEPWMLNGHSGNIDPGLKKIVAFLVVTRKQTVTDTYDYGGHSPTSLHYPWNNPDGRGHAIDSAGPDMDDTMYRTRSKYGRESFRELFGPVNWYVKNGVVIGGQFPGHGDHQHTAV